MNHFLFRIIAILSLLVSMTGTVQAQAQAQAAGVRILGYGIHYGGNIVYNYKVVNSGTKTIRSFVIGSRFGIDENYSFPQLVRLPLGWTYGITSETGREILLAPGSTSQPPGWQSEVYGQQDISLHYLEWDVSRETDGTINDVKPGQTLAGFTVTVPLVDDNLLLPAVTGRPVFTGPDEKYLKGSFAADVVDSNRKHEDVWGAIELADTTPPVLTVTLNPATLWPPNDKLVPVTVTITVNDDYDPQPEIKLISITANETLTLDDAKDVQPGTDDRQFQLKAKRAGTNLAGRVYTVTYSATDGSGNKAIASATVTVPHDQGK